MSEKLILCKCREKYTEAKLKMHIVKCKLFLEEFRLLDLTISRILEKYLINKKDNIVLVRFMLKQYIKILDSKIKKKTIIKKKQKYPMK